MGVPVSNMNTPGVPFTLASTRMYPFVSLGRVHVGGRGRALAEGSSDGQKACCDADGTRSQPAVHVRSVLRCASAYITLRR